MTDGATKLMVAFMAVSGTAERYGGGGRWLKHRTVVCSGLVAFLPELRSLGLVESYGKGRNRRHALTKAGMKWKG